VIVDELRSKERNGRVELSAGVHWHGGDFRLFVAAPRELACREGDGSPFLCASLLLAMQLGEDLELRAPVSRLLLERAPRIIDRYSEWDPRLHRARVRAEGELAHGSRAAGIGCFFSRGVDSTYSATAPRGLPGALTQLVYCDRLEPLHNADTRAEEIRLAREAARTLGIPLRVIETNLRELSDPIVGDWADMAGGGLAFLANAMAGGLGHMVIPSSAAPTTLVATGTSPLLDPMFSTEELEIHHDALATRPAKVGWLARERPDLLPHLKVCFHEDRRDNCGRCHKCVLTMLALKAAGALELATGFPAELDPHVLAAAAPSGLQPREEFHHVEHELRARGAIELADRVADALARGAAVPIGGALRSDSPAFLARVERRAALAARSAGEPRPAPVRKRRARPRTSVMMPAYNAEATLREAVASVLGQTCGEFELIVVDDGSDTPVAEVLADFHDPRLRSLTHERNRGPSAARNTALAAASAPLVSQLDADDRWEPDYLAELLPCFDDPDIGLAYSNCTIVGHPAGYEDCIGDPAAHPLDHFPKLSEQNPIPSPTATMRTLAVRAAGGYARWLRQAAEHHLYMKLARAGWRFAYVDRRLARYRWPDPGRGVSHHARRQELWHHAMYASFAARHPRTPGPRRQVRARAHRELTLARDLVGRRPSRLNGTPPRLLVDPGSHAMLNLGDVAMLQVCVERLRELYPTASIGVVTSSPELLGQHCPGTEAVPAAGRYEWFGRPWDGGAYVSALAAEKRARLERLAEGLRGTGRRAARAALYAELAAREPAGDDVREFVGWLLGSDALVISGRGHTTDAFLKDSLETLKLLRTAAALGARTAMFSQGIGPIDDERLRLAAAQALPLVDRIAVRERNLALPLLERLGVSPERVTVTGDDALEAAYRLRPERPSADTLGVSLRVTPYSGIIGPVVDEVAAALERASARHEATLVAVPISALPLEADARHLERILGPSGPGPATPREAIELAGRCRVMVAGTYHAAVFALAQGVPVVALSATPYYDAKLGGLADLFPGGCMVLSTREPDLAERLAEAIRGAWQTTDEDRAGLLSATERQIEAARLAYAHFAPERVS